MTLWQTYYAAFSTIIFLIMLTFFSKILHNFALVIFFNSKNYFLL